MNIGMLWFNNDKKMSLEAVLQQAADYYKGKYGTAPDVCFVSDKQYEITTNGKIIAGMKVTVKSTVPVKHYWIGVNDPVMAEQIHKNKDSSLL